MYKYFIKPLMFRMQPEKAHYFAMGCLSFLSAVPGISSLIRMLFTLKHPKLERKLFGLKFNNPVGLAAGFDKDARWFNQLANLGFGFIEVGTLTPRPQSGNTKPRLFRIVEDQGLINRMGFNNLGAEDAIKRLKKRKTNIIIGGNIGKNTETDNNNALDDYIFNFKTLHDYVDYFVVNISCPNVKDLSGLQNTEFLVKLFEELHNINASKLKPKPILLKISPDLNKSELDEVVDLAIKTKIDGIIATNTTTARNDLKTSAEKINGIGLGGLSGKPVQKRSTEVIKYLKEKSNNAFPVIGVGGIHSPEDAIEKLNAGADLIQIYTGFIYEGPGLIKKINKKILSAIDR